jgi:hypothetical protein
MQNIEKIWRNNLKIHYIWTSLISFSFLSPVISLYYKHYSLDVADIVFLWSFYYFFIFILEIPTSTLWDNFWRVKTLILSILSWFIPLIIYLFFPYHLMFFVAIFFSALWQALWNWNAQAKLEDDLKAIWKKADYWKTIWKLVSLTQIWKLLTPLGIYAILKYSQNPYTILAIIDLIVYCFVFITISRFKEIDESYILKSYWFKHHIETIKECVNYIISSKNIKILLLCMIFWTDMYFLSKVILPVMVDGWVKDYVSSIIVWFWSLFSIIWWLNSNKFTKKLGYKNAFTTFVSINSILHFLAFYFFDYKSVLPFIYILITFIEFAYLPVRNHILMEITPVRAKATIRSLFISIVLLYQFFMMMTFSFIDTKIALLVISVMMIVSVIFSRRIGRDV